MAGTIPLSMTQQFDIYGKPLSGGQLYIIQVGTVSTPQDAFQDTGLTIKMPYPMTLDAAGRVPQFFLADGSVKIRLQDKSGVVQLASDSVLVIGPSAGGGGGSTVDPTQLIQTGNMILRYGVGALSGYVRGNGLTIGSATSGSTERANADCQNLFQYLWGVDPSLSVSSGRGASAIADWTANKQIATPDWRGYAIGGLDDMGNTAANRLGTFFANPTTLGSVGGSPSVTLAATNIPPHLHAGNTGDDTPDHDHNYTAPAQNVPINVQGGGTFPNVNIGGGTLQTSGARARHHHPFTTDGGAGLNSTAFGIISPRKLLTFYLKL
jgi:hypothetical protein